MLGNSFSSRVASHAYGVMKKHSVIWLLGILLIFFVVRIPLLTKEYAPDEPIWVKAAEGIVKTGLPVAYNGELNKEFITYWRPPVFPAMIALSTSIFGNKEWSNRLVPLIFSFGQILLILALSKRIFGKEKGSILGLISALVVSIHPFFIQNSVFMEIDGSISAFFILLLLYFAWPIYSGEKISKARWASLFFVSLISFATRIETTAMIFFALTLLILARSGFKKALKTAAVFFASIISFTVLFALYNAAFGKLGAAWLPFQFTLNYLGSSRFQSSHSLFGAILPIFSFAISSILWLTIPFALITVFLIFYFLFNRNFRDERMKFLIIPALVILASYAIAIPGTNFPKYIVPAILPLLISAVFLLTEKVFLQTLNLRFVAAFTIVSFFVLKDTPLVKILFLERTHSSKFLAAGLSAAALVAGFLLALALKNAKKMNLRGLTPTVSGGSPRRWRGFIKSLTAFIPALKRGVFSGDLIKYLTAAIIILFLINSSFLIFHDLSVPYTLAGYSGYGNYGYKEAGEYLKKIAKPGEIVLTTDNIGYYYGGAYYDIGSVPNNFKADVVAVYRVPPQAFQTFISGKRLLASFGTVEIYKNLPPESD